MCRASQVRSWFAVIVLTLGIAGCNDDERLTTLALETSSQQASQNEELAKLNREVAQGTRQLIESRGQADQQVLSQQQALDRVRAELEAESRAMATERRRESLLAPILLSVGSLLICSLPLILCWHLLRRLETDSAETQVTKLLIEQLATRPIADGSPSPEAIALPLPDESIALAHGKFETR